MRVTCPRRLSRLLNHRPPTFPAPLPTLAATPHTDDPLLWPVQSGPIPSGPHGPYHPSAGHPAHSSSLLPRMRNSAGAAFDLAEYAAGTDDSLPLPVLISPRASPTSPDLRALRDSLALSVRLSSPPGSPCLSYPGLARPGPRLVCRLTSRRLSPRHASPRRARPLINGPAHFAGMNGAKNYALLNTDELRERRAASRIPRVSLLGEFLGSRAPVSGVRALLGVVIDRPRDPPRRGRRRGDSMVLCSFTVGERFVNRETSGQVDGRNRKSRFVKTRAAHARIGRCAAVGCFSDTPAA